MTSTTILPHPTPTQEAEEEEGEEEEPVHELCCGASYVQSSVSKPYFPAVCPRTYLLDLFVLLLRGMKDS